MNEQPTTKQSFGKNLTAIRKKRHLSRKEVAEKLGITTRSYGFYENDETTPPITRLPIIASILHCSIDELFGYKVNPNSFDDIVWFVEDVCHLHVYRISSNDKDNGKITIGLDEKGGLGFLFNDEDDFVNFFENVFKEFQSSPVFSEMLRQFLLANIALQTQFIHEKGQTAVPVKKQKGILETFVDTIFPPVDEKDENDDNEEVNTNNLNLAKD